MTIGMFSSTMPMFLTFLVNKLYKKWRKLFKFGGDKSLINLRILNLLVQLCVDVKSFLKVVDWGSFLIFIFERQAVPSMQLSAPLHVWKNCCVLNQTWYLYPIVSIRSATLAQFLFTCFYQLTYGYALGHFLNFFVFFSNVNLTVLLTWISMT